MIAQSFLLAFCSIFVIGCQSPNLAGTSSDASQSTQEGSASAMATTVMSGATGKLKLISRTDDSNSESDSSALLTKFKSAQYTFSEAVIQIQSIQISGPQGKYAVQMDPFSIDLTKLDTEFDQALVRVKLPAGSYDSIRLITDKMGYAKASDGTVLDLDVPSGTTSGIKVFFDQPIVISESQLTIATFHFDVSKSFVVNSKSVHFKPVIRPSVSAPISLESSTPSSDGSGSTSTTADSSGSSSGTSSSTTSSSTTSSDSTGTTSTSSGTTTTTDTSSTGTTSATPSDSTDANFFPVLGV